MLPCFLAKHMPEWPGLVNKVQPLKWPLACTGLPALWPGWGGSPARDGVIDMGTTENTAEIVHTNVI